MKLLEQKIYKKTENSMSMSKKVMSLGIDLGTTMSCMAGVVNGEVQIIENKDGEHLTPSVVCFNSKGGSPIVGSSAILAASATPSNYVYEVKRLFGKGYHHPDVQKARSYWPFELREIKSNSGSSKDDVDNIGIVVKEQGKEVVYEPVQVSAAVLSYLIESAKIKLGDYPRHIVITTPAYFNDSAKKRTVSAATIAFSGKKDSNNESIEVNTTLLSEPTAAALNYGTNILAKMAQGGAAPVSKKNEDGTERILVFDLGGGTYDVSVLDFNFDPANPMGLVTATDGDNFLGGSDFDNIIMNMAKAKFRKDNADLVQRLDSMGSDERKKSDIRLRQEAIKIKAALSTNKSVNFNLPCYCDSRDLTFEITQAQFNHASTSLFNRLLEKIKGVLVSCMKITPVYNNEDKLDYLATYNASKDAEIFRTLGAGRTPDLQRITEAIESAIREGKASISKVVMVGGSSRIPKVREILERYFGDTPNTPPQSKIVVYPLNPDEAIAYGAAYQANASSPDSVDIGGGPSMLLIEQVPLNLNIETLGGVATPVITARSQIPARKSEVFSTAADNQTSVDIVITQGNRSSSADNHRIGRFTLSGISPAPRGVPQIEVTFEVDQNNILKVTAVDKATGKQEIYVENMSNKLSDADIENMKRTAEEHAKADALFVERMNAKNSFEAMIYQMLEKVDQLQASDEEKSRIREKLNKEEEWLRNMDKETDPKEINDRMAALTNELSSILQTPNPGAASGNQ